MRSAVWWRIGWRNLWRSRGRTLITMGALALGFFAATVMVGLSDGVVAQMIENGTGLVTGQLQLHAAGYRPERSLYSTIGGRAGVDVGALVERVAGWPGVGGAAPRVYGGGLVSSGSETRAAILMGVDLQREPRVSRILQALESGRLPRTHSREVMIGAEMARKLDLAAGDEIVLVAAAADGSTANDVFLLTGIFRTAMPELDNLYAILPLTDLQDFLVLDRSRIHEVAASVPRIWNAANVASSLAAVLTSLAPDIVLEPWMAYRPDLAEYAQLAASANWIVVAVVFIMAVFGVANTMLMATYERRREFAVVRALGTTRGGIVQTVLYEGLVLGAISLVVGVLVTAPVMVWWSQAPPDLSWLIGDFTMAGSLVQANLRVVLGWQAPVMSAAALFLTSLLAALYPAVRSSRVPPADALAGLR